jgi:hypothetical protein
MDKNPFGSGTSSWEEVGVLAILDERRLFTGSAEAERVARQAVKTAENKYGFPWAKSLHPRVFKDTVASSER